MPTLEAVATLCVLAMFMISGIQKLTKPEFDVKRLAEAVPILANYAPALILAVGFFEIAASATVAKDVLEDSKLSDKSTFSLQSLMAFTVVTTLVFYANPLKIRPLLSNLSTLGALMFALRLQSAANA